MTVRDSGYVYCDYYGDVHEKRDLDPMREGPVDPTIDNPVDNGWTLEDRDDLYGEVWHFTCPGEHHILWIREGTT